MLFVDSTHEIWTQLEQRFALSNGSRKHRLNKEVYDLKQANASISEFYTRLKCIWEELESMEDLPKLTVITQEMRTFLKNLTRLKEEQRLFQFLNELYPTYSSQRNQILLMNPLPSVDSACSILQQEVSQKEFFDVKSIDVQASAFFSKASVSSEKCDSCGN